MKLKRISLLVSALAVLGGCGGSGEKSYSETTPASPPPVYTKPSTDAQILPNPDLGVAWQDTGVHDPSVLKAGDNYYIFGSHFASAKSPDLINWEYIEPTTKPLFNNYATDMSEAIRWTDGFVGNWAANVIQAPNGKYWFYYNHCGQQDPAITDAVAEVCHNRSYLGLAEADHVEGPYANKGVFLRSGYRNAQEFTDFPLDNGQTTWNGAVDPNVIDPAAFFDKSNNLWMVYGSYSGGIFVLEMDKTTGKPKAGQGYGTHLLGGDYRAIEGAYVLYSPVSDYYYLFYSVAGFAADDGYNIRIARSKTPNGPYLDPAGNDIANQGGLEIGGKLLGGFEFTQAFADEADSWGYQSPGHNSAYYDPATKKHLLVTHTRFPASSTPYPGNKEAHAVRTHEMFLNRNGWLVVSPERYVPLNGDNVVDVAEITGHYKFVVQGKAVNTTAIKSQYITLNENHTAVGAENGTWTVQGGDSFKLSIGSGNYVGVVKWQWDNGYKKLVPVFTGMASDGSTVFGIRTSKLSEDNAVVSAIADALDIPSELTIEDENYPIPSVGKSGATISWQSSDEYFIDSTGRILIPTPDIGDKTINLTAKITLNGATATKSFTVKLMARPAFKNAVARYSFENDFADAMGNFAAGTPATSNLAGTSTINFAAGKSGKAAVFTGAESIVLPTSVLNGSEYTVSFWLNSAEKITHAPAFFAAVDADNWLSVIPGNAWFTNESLIWSWFSGTPAAEMGDWSQAVASTTAPINAWQHFAITYKAPVAKLYIDGVLASQFTRADIMGNATTVALGANFWNEAIKGKLDEVLIYDYALSAMDVSGAAYNNLTDPQVFADFVRDAVSLGDLSAVRESFELKRVGPFVSGIKWTSSNEKYLKPVNGLAVVTQPTADEGDVTLTLTAEISLDGTTTTKDFTVTVKSLAPAEFSFDGDLTAKNAVAAAGKLTGDRIHNTGGVVTYVAGVVGQAANLDGTMGIRLPDNLITSSSYTISMWLKPTAFTGWTTAFFGGAAASSWLSVVPSMGGTDKTRVWADKSGYFDKAELGSRIPANEWTHLVVMVDAENNDTIKIYQNGALVLTETGFPRVMTVDGETNEFAIGVNYWDVPYNGAIDELKVFTGTISEAKIQSLYQEGVAQ